MDAWVIDALSEASGLELAAYRSEHVEERVRRALQRERIDDELGLVRLLRDRDDARARFRRAIAVPVSELFRDPRQFDVLEREILPELAVSERPLSVWSAGCADGAELVSIALVLRRLGLLEHARLLGSDMLEEGLGTARRGVYGDFIAPADVRERCHWERRDLIRDGMAPGPWRLVICRNVAIYLEPEIQRRLYESLAASVGRAGFLMLGRSEYLVDAQRLGLQSLHRSVYKRVR